jgi:hypothetical protein
LTPRARRVAAVAEKRVWVEQEPADDQSTIRPMLTSAAVIEKLIA